MPRESPRPLALLPEVAELPAVVDEVDEDAEGAEDEHEDGEGEDGGLPARPEVVQEEGRGHGKRWRAGVVFVSGLRWWRHGVRLRLHPGKIV